MLERCYTTPVHGEVSWDGWLGNIREVGPRLSVISSDPGRPSDPPVEAGLAPAADHLPAAGFTGDAVRLMTVHDSRWLVGPDPLPARPRTRAEGVPS
jgi:hypothetical protein